MSLNITPEDFFHRHTLGTAPNLEINLQVDFSDKWYLSNDPFMVFTLNGAKLPEISGTGNGTVSIKLTNDVNYYDAGIYEMKLRVFTLNDPAEKTLTVYLLVAEAVQIAVMPKSLRFEAVRNVEEAPTQRVYLAVNYPAISVILPPWIEIENQETIGTGHIFDFKPVPHANTPNENYSGNIIFNFPIGNLQERVPVSYKINGGYDESYTQAVHFTRDNDELKFYKTTPDKSFLKLMIEVKTFNQTGAIDKEFTLDLDVPFSKHLAVLNLGKELEAYFPDLSLIRAPHIFGVYPPTEARITALEIKNEDFSVLNQDVLPLQYFLRGKRPFSSRTTPFWVNPNPGGVRMVSSQAVVSLSVFKPAQKEIQKIEMRRNGVLIDTISSQGHKFGVMRPYFTSVFVNLGLYNFQTGDEITFRTQNATERSFIIRPYPKHSLLIAFITEWNTYEILEFTGGMHFVLDYHHETSELSKDYQFVVKKINSENPQKAVINTGWMHPDEIFTLDELIRSRKGFLLSKNISGVGASTDETIELVPVHSKITNFDSDANMYEFDVEFLINPSYANKIYSR